MSELLAFGLGYSASVLATRLATAGWSISGTSRTPAGRTAIIGKGWRGLVFDGAQPSASVKEALSTATHVLLSIPPDAAGDPALIFHGADIAASRSIAWIGYFSTVGVYGDHAGGWVDEETPCNPAAERAKRRLAAENAWISLGEAAGKRINVFRLPGIYGPGRSAIEAVTAGTARRIVKPGQVFNRIHVDDIASAVERVMRGPTRHTVYNITDDEPSPPQDAVLFAAGLLGVPPPPEVAFATADLSPMARSFYAESKRVSNARMKADLGMALRYPSYRDGLAAIAAAKAK